jgi:predicted transcriptional regulator
MPKTITIRLDDDVYQMFQKAADGERRSISNFIEVATLSFLTNDIYVSDIEMNEILKNTPLSKSLKTGLNDIKKGKYKIVS